MTKLRQFLPNFAILGILPDILANVVTVQRFGSEVLKLVNTSPDGEPASTLLLECLRLKA